MKESYNDTRKFNFRIAKDLYYLMRKEAFEKEITMTEIVTDLLMQKYTNGYQELLAEQETLESDTTI